MQFLYYKASFVTLKKENIFHYMLSSVIALY